jgi:hypothetical protein
MADEAPADTTTAPETKTEATAPEAAVDAPAATADASADDATVLGGEPDPAAADPVEPEAPVIPEKYELTAPEGMTFDDEAFDLATPVFKELGLTNEAAQKLMPVAGEFAKRAGAAAIAKHQLDQAGTLTTMKREWLENAKGDAEIGGAKWDETVSLAAKGLDALGFVKGHPFRALLDETGFGNNPEMIRAWRRVGERVGEDTFHRGGTGDQPQHPARILYPNDKPKGA